MEITCYGNTSFYIKGKKASLALNPVKAMPSASIALYSISPHEVSEAKHVIDWPGEYEVSEVFLTGTEVPFGDKKTILYSFILDEMKVLYLPNLDHMLSEEVMEKIGDADIVLLPVGGNGVFDAKMAAKMVEEVDPKVVIPMQHSEGGFEPVSSFLKEVGKTGLGSEPSVLLEKSKLPIDATEFHVLEVK